MRGPKAPKDPVAKRPAVYVMVDSVIDGSPRGNGKFQDICYLNGRIAQKILVKIDKDAEEALLERQREEQEQAAKELEEAELARQAEEAAVAGETVSEQPVGESSAQEFVKEMIQE